MQTVQQTLAPAATLCLLLFVTADLALTADNERVCAAGTCTQRSRQWSSSPMWMPAA